MTLLTWSKNIQLVCIKLSKCYNPELNQYWRWYFLLRDWMLLEAVLLQSMCTLLYRWFPPVNLNYFSAVSCFYWWSHKEASKCWKCTKRESPNTAFGKNWWDVDFQKWNKITQYSPAHRKNTTQYQSAHNDNHILPLFVPSKLNGGKNYWLQFQLIIWHECGYCEAHLCMSGSYGCHRESQAGQDRTQGS